MNFEKLKLACEGKTNSTGGLNIPEFVRQLREEYLKYNINKEITYNVRNDLYKYCKELEELAKGEKQSVVQAPVPKPTLQVPLPVSSVHTQVPLPVQASLPPPVQKPTLQVPLPVSSVHTQVPLPVQASLPPPVQKPTLQVPLPVQASLPPPVQKPTLQVPPPIQVPETSINEKKIDNFKYSNGDVYSGNFVNGQRSGRGKMIYANGDTFDGFWFENNKKEGTQTNLEYGYVYTGSFVNEAREGKGIMKFNSGKVLDGIFVSNKFISGKLITAEGYIYEGYFTNLELNGEGKFTYDIFSVEGLWKDNKIIDVYKTEYFIDKDNHIESIKPNILNTFKVNGISTYALYKIKHNDNIINILLLGEYHYQYAKDCNIDGNLRQWFEKFKSNFHKTNNNCLDLLVETPLLVNYDFQTDKYFQGMYKFRDHNDNKFRYHHVDYRNIDSKISYFNRIYFEKDTKTIKFINELPREFINKCLYYLIHPDKTNNKYIIELLEKLEEYNSSANLEYKFLVKYEDIIKKRYNKLNLNTDKFIDSMIKSYDVLNNFVAIMCVMMDVYCMTRLFTNFNKKLTSVKQCSNINNAIIYGGSQHIYTYIRFFKHYFNVDPVMVEQFKNYCIDIPLEFLP
jgi:hypothetical protein